MCMVLSTGAIKKDDLSGELDLATIIDQALPKKLSARTKSDATTIGKFNLYRGFHFKFIEIFNETAGISPKLRSRWGLMAAVMVSTLRV